MHKHVYHILKKFANEDDGNMSKLDYVLEHLTIPQYFDIVILPSMPDYYSDLTVDFELRPVTRCPLHSESTGSFRYKEDGEFFYCFGCGCGGNVVKLHQYFLEKEHGIEITWDQAVEEMYQLATKRGLTIIKNPYKVAEVALNSSTALLKFNLALNKYMKYLYTARLDKELLSYLITQVDAIRSGVLGQGVLAETGIVELKALFDTVIKLRKEYSDNECLIRLK